MADLVIPTGYGLMNLEMTHAGIQHKAQVTFGFQVAGTYDSAANAAALTGLANIFKLLHDAEVTYSRLVTLLGGAGPLVRIESTGSVVGTRAAQTIQPPNVTWLLRKTTAYAGRRYRGRCYIPFISGIDVQQTGQLQAAALTLLQTAASSLNTMPASIPAAMMNSWALLHADSPSSATPAPTANAFAASGVVATQRRRLERN